MKKLLLPLFAVALLASCGGESGESEEALTICQCADTEFVSDKANAKKCLELAEEMGTEEYGKAILDCAKEDAK